MTTHWKASHGTSFGSGLEASVVDESRRAICFCLSIEESERIAEALNAQEDARERLVASPAVVYQDANQNAPSATDGAKESGLEVGEQ